MRQTCEKSSADEFVRRLRWAGLGALAGLVLWCAAHMLPTALAQLDPDPRPHCPYLGHPDCPCGEPTEPIT